MFCLFLSFFSSFLATSFFVGVFFGACRRFVFCGFVRSRRREESRLKQTTNCVFGEENFFDAIERRKRTPAPEDRNYSYCLVFVLRFWRRIIELLLLRFSMLL
jgi:hypothetical protein